MQAASYYAQAKNSEALADALYRLEDFEGLEQLTAALPEGSPLLLHLGERFQSVGLCQPAAAAYIKVTLSACTLYSLLGCTCLAATAYTKCCHCLYQGDTFSCGCVQHAGLCVLSCKCIHQVLLLYAHNVLRPSLLQEPVVKLMHVASVH